MKRRINWESIGLVLVLLLWACELAGRACSLLNFG